MIFAHFPTLADFEKTRSLTATDASKVRSAVSSIQSLIPSASFVEVRRDTHFPKSDAKTYKNLQKNQSFLLNVHSTFEVENPGKNPCRHMSTYFCCCYFVCCPGTCHIYMRICNSHHFSFKGRIRTISIYFFISSLNKTKRSGL